MTGPNGERHGDEILKRRVNSWRGVYTHKGILSALVAQEVPERKRMGPVIMHTQVNPASDKLLSI